MIKKLPVHLKGRDFVCGDIHGSFSRVQEFLKAVNFDKTHDRLISVGDIIDRGPENEKCLDLLYEPWFHAVMGNHEFMMIDAFMNVGSKYGITWLAHGGMWARDYVGEASDMGVFVRGCVEDVMSKLPLLITVDLPHGKKFHVLHAEIYHTEPLTDDDFADEYMLKQLATRQTYDGDFILWGRKNFIRLFDKPLDTRTIEKFKTSLKLENKELPVIFNDKLSHIYSGHTIIRQPVQFYGQTNLDTMAYGSYSSPSRYGLEPAPKWCGLTVTEPFSGRFWLVNDSGAVETKQLIIS